MINFKYLRPSSLEEAFEALGQPGINKVLAGGTDLVVGIRDRKIKIDSVISLIELGDIQKIEVLDNGDVKIGAACKIIDIINNDDVKDFSKIFVSAISTIGSNQIRNRATLGGNICNASPAADSVPLLLTFDADVVISNSGGYRQIPLNDFLLSRGKTSLEKGELLTHIILPNEARKLSSYYKKVGIRSIDISMVSVAVSLQLVNHSIGKARIALGSVDTRPIRAYAAEDYIESVVNPDLKELGQLLAQEVKHRDSIRASSEYRSEMVKNLTLKGLSVINSNWER